MGCIHVLLLQGQYLHYNIRERIYNQRKIMAKKLTPLKNKLWKIISEYIRRKYADENEMVSCVTCGHYAHISKMQAGHFIPQAQGNSVRWLEDNIHPQCFRCNMNLGGNGAEYYPFMIATYGQARVDEIRALSRKTIKLTVDDYEELIEEYSSKLNRLK